jgi:Glycosyltransferases, probably involved in cell wall biogenesis
MRPAISVIVPIFKVERFIERNARQLFMQDMEGVEYIFVDDCSPDNSVAILEKVIAEFPDRAAATSILRHETNKGLPSARNSGLMVAKGEFIFHCDSDDWIEKDALSQLYNTAVSTDSDVVWCDWYLSFKNNERYMSQAPPEYGQVTGFQLVKLMLGGRIRFNVWNKLVKRTLYERVDHWFPDGYGMGEDMTMIRLISHANKVTYLPSALYHYVQLNPEAYTQNMTPRHLDQLLHNVTQTIQFLKSRYGTALDEDIQFFKLNVKLPLLISNDIQSYQRWSDWYPDANAYIKQNPLFNKRIKFIQYAAVNRQYWILKLYYHLVIRFIYGVIFK